MIITAWKLGAALATGNSVVLKPASQSPLTALRLAELAVGGRSSRRRPQRRHRPGRGHRRRAGAPPRRRQDRVHRLDRGRAVAAARGRRVGRQGDLARARWQEPAGRPGRRRRPRGGGLGDRLGDLLQQRPDLQRRVAAGRPSLRARGARRAHRRARASGWRPGEPLDPKTRLGSIVDERQLAKVLGYVGLGREEGARVVAGGERVRQETGGYYIEPTILDGVANSMRVSREEIFGPVLTVTEFEDEDEAHRHRQRHAVRPRRRPVDARRQPGPPAVAPDPRRDRLGQHLRHGRHHRPVRWLQAIGLRARQGPPRPRRLHPAQDDLVRPLRTLTQTRAAMVVARCRGVHSAFRSPARRCSATRQGGGGGHDRIDGPGVGGRRDRMNGRWLEPTQAEIDAWVAKERERRAGVAERPDPRRTRGVRPAPPSASPGGHVRRGRGDADRQRPARACASDARASSPRKARSRSCTATRGARSRSSFGPVANGRRRPPCRSGAGASPWMTRDPEGSSPARRLRVALESRHPTRRRPVAADRVDAT